MFLRHRKHLLMAVIALSMLITGSTPHAAATTDPTSDRASVSKPAPVDVNRAGVEELMTLPGIGQVTAERIVAFREEHGPFSRVEDLMKVKGIGEKSFQKLRDRVTVTTDR